MNEIKFICDGCGETYFAEPNSDDGENQFCDNCWRSMEIQNEIMENEKRAEQQ